VQGMGAGAGVHQGSLAGVADGICAAGRGGLVDGVRAGAGSDQVAVLVAGERSSGWMSTLLVMETTRDKFAESAPV
jgi:hypothetical protein